MLRFLTVAITALTVSLLAVPSAYAQAVSKKQMEANKKTVAAFYDAVLNKKDYNLALTFIGKAGYKQHNPTAKDGVEGMQGFINFLKEKFPNNKSEIKKSFADGNYVIVHVHAVREPGTRGNAIIDIFPLDEKGKVVEHWDAVQPIPETAQNTNTMF